jgi:hypothetical protein
VSLFCWLGLDGSVKREIGRCAVVVVHGVVVAVDCGQRRSNLVPTMRQHGETLQHATPQLPKAPPLRRFGPSRLGSPCMDLASDDWSSIGRDNIKRRHFLFIFTLTYLPLNTLAATLFNSCIAT